MSYSSLTKKFFQQNSARTRDQKRVTKLFQVDFAIFILINKTNELGYFFFAKLRAQMIEYFSTRLLKLIRRYVALVVHIDHIEYSDKHFEVLTYGLWYRGKPRIRVYIIE